ncbi:DNA primase [Pacificimonas flava]|uniref:DNA primase n=2 Tax=Pacificimonas TaxID=1960290 RepID=A0A219B659_9SPHN|nr:MULTISPECIES: DNA primase [Pacificimonas]MBZ6378886.1 DNA primase [Pacificimonas aurantium]OWV33862.1 DNA primase [Pacificimonas flava]
MSIPPQFLEELRNRVPVSEIVGRRVKLIRAGREFKACCPFHNEKTPSFYVNDDKAFYHCFGCGAHGDVVSFLIDQEGMEFRDAVETLAVQAGLDMPQESPEARARAKAAQGLHDVAGLAAAWFQKKLHEAGGAEARQYLERRGLSGDTVRDFAIGFAPGGRGAIASALDAPRDKLIAAGLLVQPDDPARDAYDRFRSRIMFPIRDQRGRTVGFGGRIFGEGEPKYLNSPDGPLFDKGRLLYNLDKAAPAARKSSRLAVVEGYMDVIALAQAGFPEAVAPMGTALTEEQMQLAWRAAPEPVLCFDGDNAGIRAANRAALRALPLLQPGKSVRFALLPEGQDPDDLVKQAGLSAFERLIDTAESLIDHLWRMETEGVEMDTPERRANVRKNLYAHAGEIADEGIAQLYRAEFKSRFDALFAPKRRGERMPAFATGASASMKMAAQRSPYEREIVAMLSALLARPELAAETGDALAELEIADPDLARLRSAIFHASAADPELDKNALRDDLSRRGLGQLADDVSNSNRLTFSFTRPRTPAAVAAEDLACVAGHLMALAHVEAEQAEIRSRGDWLTEEEFERRVFLSMEKARVERELAELAQGRRETEGEL